MASYIAQSALASFILEISRTHEAGIRGLTLEFANQSWNGANWRVATIDYGTADPIEVRAIVAVVTRQNASWVMVVDGSDLDGALVPP